MLMKISGDEDLLLGVKIEHLYTVVILATNSKFESFFKSFQFYQN